MKSRDQRVIDVINKLIKRAELDRGSAVSRSDDIDVAYYLGNVCALQSVLGIMQHDCLLEMVERSI